MVDFFRYVGSESLLLLLDCGVSLCKDWIFGGCVLVYLPDV